MMRETIGSTFEVLGYFKLHCLSSRSFYAFHFQRINIHMFAIMYRKKENIVINPIIHFPIINALRKNMKSKGSSTHP